jgi:hypothetical protein
MSTVGFSTLDVIPSVKGLRANLERQTSADFAAAGRRGGQQFGDAAAKEAGGRFKSKFAPLMRDAFAPIAGLVAGAGIVELFKSSIEGASDLAESGNKISVIFGDAAEKVDAFASKGAKALGQTRLEVLNAAGTFGTFGKAAGLSGDDLADFSTKLVGLSTDMASFFNTSPQQAIEAIGAALRGEAEPIRAYGVLLDDATLRQEALRQGLIKTTKQALTPQQKVLAGYQVILRQTRDAQGDFERTSGGLANQQRILSAQWAEMRAELGTKLLPVVTDVTRAFNDDVLPAIGSAGGAVQDAARAFAGLPGPVKATAAAFVAMRVAAAAGLGTALAAGAASAGSALASLRLRAMFAADQFRVLRAGQVSLTAGSGQFTAGVGRMAASLGALRVAGAGAGAGLRRGLAGASALVGGPWGAAFLAGTAVVAHFWIEHQKAKQHVQDLTQSLREQDGAITRLTKDTVFKSLQDSGAVDLAKKYGIALNDLLNASLGNAEAGARVNAILDAQRAKLAALPGSAKANGKAVNEYAIGVTHLREAIGGQNSALDKAKTAASDHAEAIGQSSSATKQATGSIQTYSQRLAGAREAVQKLLAAEDKRRQANLNSFRDRTALVQALADARKEAREGARTLDINSEAGRKNRDALAALADQWNNSANSVKNAKGAYSSFREQFIKIADSMGVSRAKAKSLADQLLGIPKNNAYQVHTPGMEKALADAKKLREEFAAARKAAVNIAVNRLNLKDRDPGSGVRRARGGLITGPGTGTSDSILMWGSNGEFMQRKAAVDYYGVDFMRRLNNLQIPRHAQGGLIGGATTTVTHGPGVNIQQQTVVVPDTRAYLREMQMLARMSSSDGVERRG